MKKLTVAQIKELIDNADPEQLELYERTLAADDRISVRAALKAASKRADAIKKEQKRLDSLYDFDKSMRKSESGSIVGLDEVGRGPVAGPLAVGAVILPDTKIEGLNDSKQISERSRYKIAECIKEEALAWTVTYVSPQEIDDIGMTASLKRAFSTAISTIEAKGFDIDVVLIDGNPLKVDPREHCVVKGDSKSASIAAASIVAKCERDSLMIALDEEYPGYGFSKNKGYGTNSHLDAIRTIGITDQHRKSFLGNILQQSLFDELDT